jgi:hypothetical protein
MLAEECNGDRRLVPIWRIGSTDIEHVLLPLLPLLPLGCLSEIQVNLDLKIGGEDLFVEVRSF